LRNGVAKVAFKFANYAVENAQETGDIGTYSN
jgi:hypothetical protein